MIMFTVYRPIALGKKFAVICVICDHTMLYFFFFEYNK